MTDYTGTNNADSSQIFTPADAPFTWDALAGDDTLNFDATGTSDALTTSASVNVGGGYDYTITDTVTGAVSTAFHVEHVNITGGSGDDTFITVAPDLIDGGAGTDSVTIARGDATTALSYDAVMAATGTGWDMEDGTEVFNVERLAALTTGSGADLLIAGTAQDGLIWHAGAGFDVLSFDATADTSAILAKAYDPGDGSVAYSIYDSATGLTSQIYGAESVIIRGGAGDDTLAGLAGPDTLDGGDGTDTVSLDRSAATVDIYYDATAAATSAGTTLQDGTVIQNVERLGTLTTGSGDDALWVTTEQDGFTWNAGDGRDALSFDATGDANAIIATAYDPGDGSISYMINDAGVTSYAHDIESVDIIGGDANDSLMGTSGNDKLDGGAGIDTLAGGWGKDIYFVDNTNDVIIEGQNGVDDGSYDRVVSTATYTLTDGLEELDLRDTGAPGSGNIDGTGNDEDNVIVGTDENNVLSGMGGDDLIQAGAGNDTLLGGSGSDSIAAELGADTIDGGAGNDRLYGEGGADIITGGSGNDDLYGDGSYGANGVDGNDVLDGGDGNDRLWGDSGSDQLTGGGGHDGFYIDSTLNGADVIMDFNAAEDTLILEGVSDAFDHNVQFGASADGDVLLTFAGSGGSVELNGYQAANYANLGALDAAINITYQ